MEKTTLGSVEIPTALPGSEDDDAREKLLIESSSDELEDSVEDEGIGVEEPAAKPRERRWRMLRTFAGFAIFLCVLVVAIAWFFRVGWFSEPQAQAVNRSGQRDAQTSPATEDEKLKMALSMVAPASPPVETAVHPDGSAVADENARDGVSDLSAGVGDVSPGAGGDRQANKILIGEKGSYSLPGTVETPTDNATQPNRPQAVASGDEPRSLPVSGATDPDDARGRSLFFGISKKPASDGEIRKPTEPAEVKEAISPKPVRPAHIPFGTLLPVRLVGSIYTLGNSGGFVRMELTRAVEGKGYAYPAGTMIVGNVRGGESVRAFINIVGLIDPDSGELVRFGGELLGRDGSSGIEGKRRNLTSQWSRFFRGMKDTAASVLGSVGALRSSGTVILSEPIRRGTESVTGDLSGAILKNEREDTFLEVAAGSNGYVLVTGLHENSTGATSKPTPEAGKE
jgi:hypothetical protein